ncbi:MAG: DNA methyltransferase [Chloroflexi bacterium]|nr:DNA methyltransferase [Chloroflexota bacterium]
MNSKDNHQLASNIEIALQEPSIHQLPLLNTEVRMDVDSSSSSRLSTLLSEDLDFHSSDTGYATHDFHSFPAKFPPQLPRKFILGLTEPGEIVLDPMMGSGTTILEALLNNRRAVGFDIDPLARLISKVKTTSINIQQLTELGKNILAQATVQVENRYDELLVELETRWDSNTKDFINYWFAKETQVELLALVIEIQKITDEATRAFCELAFSACIITKSGGVSLAFDLAHTRPHRARVAYSPSGNLIIGEPSDGTENARTKLLTKRIRPALFEFKRKFQQNLKSLVELDFKFDKPLLAQGNSQNLTIDADSIDLIVTSPPYASNAIDYMRAHKFSLVWLGYSIHELTDTRKDCIGGENTSTFYFESLPDYTSNLVNELRVLDSQKGKALHRYYTEMKRTLREMYRVLKPGKIAIVVVASSIMRGKDTETGKCLAEIGNEVGFNVPKIGVRQIDRNRRMLPAGMKVDHTSQIQQRMHEEYVIGFYKPQK